MWVQHPRGLWCRAHLETAGEAQGSARGLPLAGQLLRGWTLASAPVGPCAEGQWLTPREAL